MNDTDPDWERRVAALWDAFDAHTAGDFSARMTALVRELPTGHPVAAYERASVHDALGHETEAAGLYQEALAGGLAGPRRRQAVIQYASTLRNLGRAAEGVALLTAERDAASDALDDAVAAFLALALADAGRAREAVGVALGALAPHLPSYTRSVGRYARELAEPSPEQ
ncbi:tetratricopeptide repeat protein [Streptomyces sp. DSM 42041]|uniref:Tetratricopeptide repeat protein n=1 Tax=Streptomyces hazeniae TaxID=3075538 RepID=A0ABU2NN64_9ACTN|nr:tetratricopeptide repeat protein [Streptomyces sp. DSM 42041]MDT0378420.1 tetratricopeptide repeat protein [Streptomyces sp. DSM 42041]